MSEPELFADRTATATIVNVLVPYPVDRAYSYAVPDGMNLAPGDYVTVPLGPRQVAGVVWDGPVENSKKLKSIIARSDLPPVGPADRRFIEWVAQYTMSPKGFVLKMLLSVPAALEPEPTYKAYRLTPSPHGGEGGGRPARGEGVLPRQKPDEDLTTHARDMRKVPAYAERKMWFALRDRRFEDLKFRRQFPIPPYIADFVCVEKQLVVEIDGGQHGEMVESDARRTAYFERHGYRVVRFWNNEVLGNSDGVLQVLSAAVQTPSPQPSPRGGEGVQSGQPARSSPSPQRGEGRGEGGFADLNNLSPQRRKIAQLLEDGIPRRLTELAEQAGCSVAVVRAMAKAGLLETVDLYPPAPCHRPDPDCNPIDLSGAQASAAERLREMARADAFQVALLDGVTGAGKTEVYFEGFAETLRRGKQILLLLPEIALSNAFLDRFHDRFGCRPALWHSNLTPAQRRQTWRSVAEGQTKVVVGARSALFLPFRDLGFIIVDEEHDPAYKQEDNVIYHARDMAVVRAHLNHIPILLVSATPSLETMANAWAGRYVHLHLPNRHGGASLPDIQLIDMRVDKPERQHFIAPTLRRAITQTLEAGHQALLFLNRRGYAPLTLCRTCGFRFNCPRCTAWLVEHRRSGRLECHHCGYHTDVPEQCPSCGDKDSFAACGPGVERVFEEAKALFPDARIMVLASDTAETQDALRDMLRDVRDHKVDIVIGTQIIAKGHHFPHLTCVGVIDADLGLQGGDLRAAERTYQLLHQVAGRAGREDHKGHVYLQTFYPDNKVMQALIHQERDRFFDVEAQEREAAHMPPFTRLAGLIVAGKDEQQVADIARELGRLSPHADGVEILGPAEAPFYRLRGLYRRRMLVRAGKELNIQKLIEEWLAQIRLPSTVRIYVDIDPQNFL